MATGNDLTAPLLPPAPGDDPPPPSPRSSTPSRRASGGSPRFGEWPRTLSQRDRGDYLARLIVERRQTVRRLFPAEEADAEEGLEAISEEQSQSMRRSRLELESSFVRHLKERYDGAEAEGEAGHALMPEMEVRLMDVSYTVPASESGTEGEIQTVSSPLHKMKELLLRQPKEQLHRPPPPETTALVDVNLVLRPKSMYLVLGPPLSGKTTLLKAIAGMTDPTRLTGRVLYNNLVCTGEGADTAQRNLFRNLVAFVPQSDAHAPRLTVEDTLLFSSHCKGGDGGIPAMVAEGLGLSGVTETFVGNEQIRGVSGGQRRRVTLGEMLTFDTPLICGDEISTGLDTASTVDILRMLSYMSRTFKRVSVISLLQPSPEAVALFDEVILLGDGGHIIYAGPTGDASAYFRDLGYVQPDSMDNADYLLAVASTDRALLRAPGLAEHSVEDLAAAFKANAAGQKIKADQEQDWALDWTKEECAQDYDGFKDKYKNSFWVSAWLNLQRAFVLWTRDRIFIRASVIKNIAMGLSVGFVFQDTDMSSSFFGVLFQGNLFIMLGAMTSAPEKLDDRSVFYKHSDSNFYPAMSYLLGQAVALIPQMLIDVLLFGTCVYWLVGFVSSGAGFVLYLVLFFSFNFTMGQLFGALASVGKSKTVVQAGGAVILLLNTLFCGYIVSPSVIPGYYIWIYWLVPLSWVYRALLLNEFTSDDPEYADGKGEQILAASGFLYKGEPFTRDWIAYCFLYLFFFLIVVMSASAFALSRYRMAPKPKSSPTSEKEETMQESEKETEEEGSSSEDAAFLPVQLSFKDLSYEVKSSKGSNTLRLLNNVSGVFSSGRMCALMGESGAGKTTLMDVIALRKGSGKISGEVRLNGFPQEDISFRRCSGYVEQFDVQSPELTVRETIRFSAKLRLDKSSPVYDTPHGLDRHIDSIIKTLELTKEVDMLVGSEEEGGLTFEQKKRVSIAVEVAASPSIVFLDEPTSGLDARAAVLVMNALKDLCRKGRTIVATIHQPSSTVFDMFDDLLLLKKGGEVVFFGDLGTCSCNLISHFEDLGGTPMSKGENPATWMLNVLGEQIMARGEGGKEESLDFAKAWKGSSNYASLQEQLAELEETVKIQYESEFACQAYERNILMAKRLRTIYWRSPAYNLARVILCLVIAFLLSSIFIPIRSNESFTETEVTSLLSTIFISFIIIGVLSITSVLPVALSIRDMYYRHKAAGMLDHSSVGWAFASAEKYFILLSSLLFCAVFIPTSGVVSQPGHDMRDKVRQAFGFWGFFTFNMAIYSYIGQLFMCSVRGGGTAQILASVFIGINNFFSGLIVRPQQMTGLWAFTYWINPGHFVYEGLCMSVFHTDDRMTIISEGSTYYDDLDCANNLVDGVCQVQVNEYVDIFFGGMYSRDHIRRNAIILGFILAAVRALTFLALRSLTYSGK